MVWLPLLLPTLAAARRSDGLQAAAQGSPIAAAHSAPRWNEHCLIDSHRPKRRGHRLGRFRPVFSKWGRTAWFTSSENFLTRDFANYGRRWRDKGAVEAAGRSLQSGENLQYKTLHLCECGRELGHLSHHVNRTANWNYWTAKEWGEGSAIPTCEGDEGYGYGMKDENAQWAHVTCATSRFAPVQLVLTTQRTSQIRHPKVAQVGRAPHQRRWP